MKSKFIKLTQLLAITGMLAITLPALRADDAPAPSPAPADGNGGGGGGGGGGGCHGGHHGGKGKGGHHHGDGDQAATQTPAPAQ